MREKDIGITFAGGGNKSFYQFGLMRRWRDRLLPRVRAVAACSAGACVAALLLSGREELIGEFWRRRCRGLTRNFDWGRLLSGRCPTPHGELYRELLLYAFADGGLDRVRSQPFPIFVITAAFHVRMPAFAAAALGLCAYTLDHGRRRAPGVHSFARRTGFRPAVFDARDCETADELADLIIASSATPPFTPLGRVRDERLLDGGIISPAPSFLAEEHPGVERSVVLRTAPPRPLGPHDATRRLYVSPSEKLPIGTWDFTRPDLLAATIERGERDAGLYDERLAAFIGD
ncbi:MAG TPA: patatin-like phospholipase family protein [Pyrinomonadaceae bacterium]